MKHAIIWFGIALLSSGRVSAQQPGANTAGAGQPSQDDQSTVRLRLPVLTVTAEKEPEDVQQAPVSVTVVPAETLEQGEIRTVGDAARFAPNTFFHEFTARKLSNGYFRGVGASPSNPGIATYIDGVPQLHANSSSVDLLDVEQVEFVRGPQSALFGRNTLGGVVNVLSSRPSLAEWTGGATVPLGSLTTREVRATASGPLVDQKLGLGVAFGYSARDGITVNDLTGNDLDSRSAFTAKGQLLWTPAANWEARFILTGERARDGDYALNDLAALRARPRHASRDYEGYTHRDIVAPTVLLRRTGRALDVTSTTGVVWWETEDSTDLDYSPLPLLRRANTERDRQFTQEVRVASARDADLSLSEDVRLKWQTGVFFFTQNYEQNAVNTFSPFVLSPFVGFQVAQTSPEADLDDLGLGVYGRGTFIMRERVEATVGLRGDYENKQASLATFFQPPIAPPTSVAAEESFSDVSPHFSLAYHLLPARQMVYASAARGFKAGGFNAASPAGSEAYDVEQSWTYEVGAKTLWFDERLSVNASAFLLTWDDLQVNVPNPFVPFQFYIDNAAGATSKGLELQMSARVAAGCDFFGGFGYTNARFDDGSVSDGVDVSGNRLANAPTYTADFGGQYTVALTASTNAFARADIIFRGSHQYDHANTQAQEAYSLTNFRAGVRGRRLLLEGWIRNAFDTAYIPIAIAAPGLAPSGFIGESGAPRTFGVRVGVSF
jgi:iron complex outermembrane receptor protein